MLPLALARCFHPTLPEGRGLANKAGVFRLKEHTWACGLLHGFSHTHYHRERTRLTIGREDSKCWENHSVTHPSIHSFIHFSSKLSPNPELCPQCCVKHRSDGGRYDRVSTLKEARVQESSCDSGSKPAGRTRDRHGLGHIWSLASGAGVHPICRSWATDATLQADRKGPGSQCFRRRRAHSLGHDDSAAVV